MKIKITLSILAMTAIIILGFFYKQQNKDVENVKEITNRLVQSISFKDQIESAHAQYMNKKAKIRVDILLIDTFDNLDMIRQFSILDYFNKQLRYFMRNGQYTSSLHTNRIDIYAQTPTNNFYLHNIIPDNKNFTKNYSTFYINQQKMYTTGMLKQHLTKTMTYQFKSSKEEDVIKYATQFFNTLTQSGKYYNPKVDSSIILNAVSDKFGINAEEFDTLYQKYQLGLQDAF